MPVDLLAQEGKCPASGRSGIGESPRAVCVTGARTGIGLGIARGFLQNGDKVCMVSRTVDKAQENEDIKQYEQKGQIVYLNKDLGQADQWKSTIDEAVKLLGGKLDVLVNNAGWGSAGVGLLDITYEHWRDHFALNTDGLFFLSQAAIPYLEKTQGCIVNISSIGGMRPANFMMSYCVTKACANMITSLLGLELAEKRIRVNAINPGVIDTDIFFASGMTDSEEEKQKTLKEIGDSTPLKRAGTPADVASLALFLADKKAAGWITGQLHCLDGGTLLKQ